MGRIRVYWDAGVWIAYLRAERDIPLKGGASENRFDMC